MQCDDMEEYGGEELVQVALIGVEVNSLDQDSAIVALGLFGLLAGFLDLLLQQLLLSLGRVGRQVLLSMLGAVF